MKKILGAAIAASMLSAGAAHAAVDDGSDFFNGNGEVVLALWDSVAKRSVLIDTGWNYNDVTAGQSQSTVNISAALNAAFGGNLSNVSWNAASAGGKTVNADFSGEARYFGGLWSGRNVSYNPAVEDLFAAQQGFQQLTAATADNTYGGDPAVNPQRDINNYYVALTDTNPIYVGNPALWGVNARYSPWNPTMVGSGTQGAYWMHYADIDGSTTALANVGTFALDLAAGTFSFTGPTSNVPVPAAAWLLVSGLAGLGTVARRRKQA